MKALIQRVKHASVEIDGQTHGQIEAGLLVLLGVEKTDTPAHVEKLVQKVLKYRVFADADDKMNLSVSDMQGGVLVVSQFTLVANTQKGLRPSFASGAPPALGETLYDAFVERCKALHPNVGTGQFGADMKVSLCNDGPVTFMLEV